MEILDFIDLFDLKQSFIENIGFEYFNNQIVLTVFLCNSKQPTYQDHEPNNIIGNFVFTGVQEIGLDKKPFRLNSNEIVEILYKHLNGDLYKLFIVFHDSEQKALITLSFTTSGVEWDPINPYI